MMIAQRVRMLAGVALLDRVNSVALGLILMILPVVGIPWKASSLESVK
jgi:hypothetical protein